MKRKKATTKSKCVCTESNHHSSVCLHLISLTLDDEQTNNDATELCSFEFFDPLQCADIIIFSHLITAGCALKEKNGQKIKSEDIFWSHFMSCSNLYLMVLASSRRDDWFRFMWLQYFQMLMSEGIRNPTPRIPNSYCSCSSVTKSVKWRYLGNEAWYHRSAGVKTTRKHSEKENENKLASLEAKLVRNYDSLTH